MNSYEDLIDADDGELALFLAEMRTEASSSTRQSSSESNCRAVFLLPGETRIDLYSVRKMVGHRNEMVKLLREFLALHPEDTRLTRRARHYTG